MSRRPPTALVLQPVPESSNKGRRYKLDDYTDWDDFRAQLWRNSKVWFDHVCWSVVNVVLMLLMSLVGLIGPVVSKAVRRISNKLHARYKVRCTPMGRKKQTKHRLSAVNAETPDIHHGYLAGADKVGGTDLSKRDFDLDNAIFLMHVCALVYEDECVLDYVLKQWHLEYEVILSTRAHGNQAAWVIYHSSATCKAGDACPRKKAKGQDFALVIFKGTSPFNFVEWMNNFTMSKISPHDDYLPGMVHEGFYRQFEWPVYLRPVVDERGKEMEEVEEPQMADATDGVVVTKEEINRRLGRSEDWVQGKSFVPKLTFYERVIRKTNRVLRTHFKADATPAIWVCGHSLGAALATLFFSHLVHAAEFPLFIGKENLKGGYTFGTPRTGDATYAKELSRHPCTKYFYNVVNANDIVCTVPLGGNAQTEDPRTLTNFRHVGKPILLNYSPTLEVGKRWGWSNAVQNALQHFLSLPARVYKSQTLPLTAVRLPLLGWLFCLVDHLPSEYLKHLEACKEPAGVF